MRKIEFELWRLRQGQRTWKPLLDFIRSESGVVTVEWIALASGLVIGAIAISFIVMQGLATPAQNIACQLTPCP